MRQNDGIFCCTTTGGCFVEGEWLRNAFRWKETVGPWEERPGHFGDVWMYWTDDGLGHFEFFQVLFCVAINPTLIIMLLTLL